MRYHDEKQRAAVCRLDSGVNIHPRIEDISLHPFEDLKSTVFLSNRDPRESIDWYQHDLHASMIVVVSQRYSFTPAERYNCVVSAARERRRQPGGSQGSHDLSPRISLSETYTSHDSSSDRVLEDEGMRLISRSSILDPATLKSQSFSKSTPSVP